MLIGLAKRRFFFISQFDTFENIVINQTPLRSSVKTRNSTMIFVCFVKYSCEIMLQI